MTRQGRSDVTRLRIITGAARVFDKNGYDGTSLTDVIAEAGVTKGALYFHFASKRELANAVIDMQHARSIDPAQGHLGSDARGVEAVIQLSQHMARQLVDDPIVRAGSRLTLETGTFDPPIREPYVEWIDALAALFRRAAETGDLRPEVDPETVARYVVGAFTGVHVLAEVLTRRADLGKRVEDMWEIFLPALVPEDKLSYFRQIARAYADTEHTAP